MCQLFQLSFELLLTHTETESYKDLEHPQLGDNTDRDKVKHCTDANTSRTLT